MAPKDERLLFERARDGDRTAMEELLRQHERNVYRFGLRLCGDEEAAKEVLQRTLLAAFEQFGSFRGEARISTWLYALARSFCSRHHRRTRSAPVHDVALDAPTGGHELAAPATTPAEAVEKAEMAQLVTAAIATLPETAREVVLLRDVEGLSAEEAAEVLGIEVGALKSRLHRGRQQLKQHLAALLRESGGALGGQAACPTLAAELARIEERDIDQTACATIERHLAHCPPCARRLGDLQQTASLCKHLPAGDVPEPVKRAVRAALLDALGPRQAPTVRS